MTFAVDEFNDDAAVARLAGGDHAALDQACAACLATPTSTWPSAAARSGCWPGSATVMAAQVSQPIPSWSPSKRWGSGASTRKLRNGTWGQSRSGGGGGMHTVG
jgi:hypothetical protein